MQETKPSQHSENTNKRPPSGSLPLDETRRELDNMPQHIIYSSKSGAILDDGKPALSGGRHVHVTDLTQTLKNRRQLYAIIDTVTHEIVGGIQLHKNHQSAIRTLYDIANSETSVNKHPLDYELYLLGALGDDHQINPLFERIITGDQISVMIQAKNNGD